MEKVEIQIRKSQVSRLKKLLDELDYLESYKVTEGSIDAVSLVAEPCLAEEWDSDEDSRWDKIL